MSSVLVAMFDTQDAAYQAKQKLTTAGFSESAVELTEGSASSGSMSGSASGSTTPAEPQGPIARFFDNLFGDSDDDGDADTYREAFNRGSYGVSVTTRDDAEMERAEAILNAAGAVDIDERSQQWRSEGWSGGTARMGAGASRMGAMAPGSDLSAGTTQKLQEVSEELKVGKRAVARGGVRIFTRMVETPVSETVRLREEHANVTRTAVDRPATEADFSAFKEGSIEVREMAEEAVVSKTARVVGEVEIGKTATERDETIRETVRETKVEVEQIEGGQGRTAALHSGAGMSSTGSTSGMDANRDPITGEPGSHPVGTGVGAAVGAVAGGMAGKGVAETIDPTTGGKSNERL